MKDDCQPGVYVVYYVMLVIFIVLAVLGVLNLIQARKLGKLKNPSILMFYVSSLVVVCLRILLFSDPIFEWPLFFYLGVLMSLPTILYMFVGFSQVMISFECIVAYMNLSHKENSNLTFLDRNAKIERNNKCLRYAYISAILSGALIFVLFVIFTIMLLVDNCDISSCSKTYQFTAPIGVLNIVLWMLLMYSTLRFISQIRQRFGTQYRKAIIKLTIILVLFSVAFLFRGFFDLWVTFVGPNIENLGMGKVGFALFVGIFYTVCEALPLLILYI